MGKFIFLRFLSFTLLSMMDVMILDNMDKKKEKVISGQLLSLLFTDIQISGK